MKALTRLLALVLVATGMTLASAEDGFFSPAKPPSDPAPSAPGAINPNPHVYACALLIEWDPARPTFVSLRYPAGADHCAATDVRAAVTAIAEIIASEAAAKGGPR